MSAPWRDGRWHLLGAPESFESARTELDVRARAGARENGVCALDGRAAYFKGSGLRGRAALRHALRARLGRAFPRLAEFRNLAWLRAHGFLAPRPLLAGVHVVAGFPRYQFLFTALVPGAPTLAELLATHATTAGVRAALLTSLARDLARLHALGFVHRDLFARNLLAAEEPEPRCVFLDAWRGGPGPGLRGPAHDLGCFLLDGASLLTPAEQGGFLALYRDESLRAGRRLAATWPARVERARRRIHAREATRRPGLRAEWNFPPLT